MYEDYLQNFWDYPTNGYQNTYDQYSDNCGYGCNMNRNYYEYDYNYSPYRQNMNYQNRGISNTHMEELYPEIYKVVYPMVKKVCSNNNRTITNELIEQMTEEVYSNVEANNGVELNITLSNNVRGEKTNTQNSKQEDRGPSRNNGLMDIIKILILRELIGRPCNGHNCRPGPRPPIPPMPPMPPYPQRPPYIN